MLVVSADARTHRGSESVLGRRTRERVTLDRRRHLDSPISASRPRTRESSRARSTISSISPPSTISRPNRPQVVTANVAGVANALAFAKSVKAGCFHHVSSIAAAGLYDGVFREDMFEEARGLDHPVLFLQAQGRGPGAGGDGDSRGGSIGRASSSAIRRPARSTRSTAPITSSSSSRSCATPCPPGSR